MKFIETKLKGAFLIEPELLEDERGFFARTWCADELNARGLINRLVQCSISFNKFKGTLRGMHFQIAPYEEVKLVRCTKGSIYDVIIDLRKESKTYMQWLAVELNEANHKMLYIPEGFAHGFLTMEDNTEVFYQISEYYHPECASGVKWNDLAFGVDWPNIDSPIILQKDMSWGDYKV